jgi:aminopeptidase N
VRLLVFGLSLLVVAAGCGGEEPIPLSEYRDRANAICRENNTEGRAEVAQLRQRLEAGGELEPDELAELNGKVLELLREAHDRLADIPPPDAKADAAEAYEQQVGEANDAFADFIEAQQDGSDAQLLEASDRNEALGEDAKKTAADLGLDECAG